MHKSEIEKILKPLYKRNLGLREDSPEGMVQKDYDFLTDLYTKFVHVQSVFDSLRNIRGDNHPLFRDVQSFSDRRLTKKELERLARLSKKYDLPILSSEEDKFDFFYFGKSSFPGTNSDQHKILRMHLNQVPEQYREEFLFRANGERNKELLGFYNLN
ncbi:hypothetical protein KAT80_02945 [Candidatus Pacearchaeota archaeon]|nr:hypothetical protein [Candidatus Pacearchaeota archaeon]